MAPKTNLVGPMGQLYADPQPSPDEVTFKQDNTSAEYYNSPYYVAHKAQVQPIPARRNNMPLTLADFVSTDILTAIKDTNRILFHAVGDTGAAKVNRSQTAATALEHQAHVADEMAAQVQSQGAGGPAFFFLLGDVIYNFGEAQYYYDQFYEPYRAYDRPIFAIPGNHDAMVFGKTSTAPTNVSLAAFQTNFCATAHGRSPDSLGLMRSVMTQPGVYFTLDAPFVSIIGLYSNTLEGPGVISSQGSHFPLTDEQLVFLKAELTRLKPQHQANQRSVVLAVHHPPLSIDAVHGGSTGLQQDLDDCCTAAGLWPDLVLSGHAHLYQRFTHRTAGGQQIPYIVAGSGGFAATPPIAKQPPVGTTVGSDTLEIAPIVEFGFLTISTDAKTLTVEFQTSTSAGVQVRDSVSVNLIQGRISTAPMKNVKQATVARKNARLMKRALSRKGKK
jgi:predicted phosphodiesterase